MAMELSRACEKLAGIHEWLLGREEKAEDILNIILADDDISTVDADNSVSKAMLPFLVNNIRQELGNLQPVFGQWSAEVEFESLEI